MKRSLLPPLLLALALLGAWELYADLGSTSTYVLPAPHAVAAALWDNAGMLAANLGPTAEEVGLGILLAMKFGRPMVWHRDAWASDDEEETPSAPA